MPFFIRGSAARGTCERLCNLHTLSLDNSLGAIRKPKESHFGVCLMQFRVEFCNSELAKFDHAVFAAYWRDLPNTWVTCLIRRTTMRMDPTTCKCTSFADV